MRAESLLDPGVLTITDTSELRARYIAKLLKPFHEQILISSYLDDSSEPTSRKRSWKSDDNQLITRWTLHVNPHQTTESKQHDHRRNLELFNPQWVRFYDCQIQSNTLKAADIYKILALASVIGGHQVLMDLSVLCRCPNYIQKSGTTQARSIYQLYVVNDVKMTRLDVQRRLLEMALYNHFLWRYEYHRDRIQLKNKEKSRNAPNKIPEKKTRIATCALDSLVIDCLEISVQEYDSNCSKYASQREKIRKIKDEGKNLFNFNERLSEIGDKNGWILVPMRRMKSAFDDNIMVKTEQYAILCIWVL